MTTRISTRMAMLVATFLISASAQFVDISKAAADGVVCNNTNTGIWFTYMKPDNTCSGTKWKQFHWFHINAGAPCQTVFTENAANRTYIYYAIGDDGTEWPGTNNYKVDFNTNNLPGGTCFDLAQGVSCTNPGTNCLVKTHSVQSVGNFTRWKVTYSR